MEFEEMKMIWDTQNDEPLYAINQEALHRKVRGKVRHVRFAVTFFEWAMLASSLVVGVILLADAIQDGTTWPQYLAAGIFIAIGLNVWRMRRRRQRQEEKFENSLLGDLDRSISRIDYTISRMRSLLWWYILPFVAATAITLYASGQSYWLLGLVVLVFGLSLVGGEWEIRKKNLPQKRELQAVRELLENG